MKIYYKFFHTTLEAQLWMNLNNLVENIISINYSEASIYSGAKIIVWYKNEMEII